MPGRYPQQSDPSKPCRVFVTDDLATLERSRWEIWLEIHHGRVPTEEFLRVLIEQKREFERKISSETTEPSPGKSATRRLVWLEVSWDGNGVGLLGTGTGFRTVSYTVHVTVSPVSCAQSKCHTCHVRFAESCRIHRSVMPDGAQCPLFGCTVLTEIHESSLKVVRFSHRSGPLRFLTLMRFLLRFRPGS